MSDKHVCFNCGANPRLDTEVVLFRANDKGVDPIWVCQRCRAVPAPVSGDGPAPTAGDEEAAIVRSLDEQMNLCPCMHGEIGECCDYCAAVAKARNYLAASALRQRKDSPPSLLDGVPEGWALHELFPHRNKDGVWCVLMSAPDGPRLGTGPTPESAIDDAAGKVQP